jgi:putative aminopeptidase FrvX
VKIDRALELLGKYSNLCAAAGDEDELRASIREDLKGCVDELGVNPLGNLTATKHGKQRDRSVLLTAHMDEVAFMVKSVEKNGLLRFYAVGGLLSKILVGNAVLVGKARKPGVVAYKSYHLMTAQERKKVPDLKDLFIDIGAGGGEEVKDISPGDYAYFRSEFFTQKGVFFGKAFDDRAGCAALASLLREYAGEGVPAPDNPAPDNPAPGEPPLTLIAVFTAQEEVGLRGGETAGFGLGNVAFNLNLEGTTCSDRELKTSYSPVTESGKGPAITFMDRTSIADRRLFEFVAAVAEKEGIPYQLKRGVAGGTDAGAVSLTEAGIPAVTVAVPVRYIHAPWGIVHSGDFDHYLKLARAVVRRAAEFTAPGSRGPVHGPSSRAEG